MAILSVMGMQKFKEAHNGNLFSKLTLPDGMDLDLAVNTILLRSAEFESIYSNPDFLEEAIGVWSKKNSWTFNKWFTAINITYNPLENYDRMEEWHDVGSTSGHSSDSSSGSSSTNSSNTRSSYDSSSMQPHDGSNAYGENHSNTNTQLDSSALNDRTGRAHGNIGVTTSQQMLQSELDIALFNLYDRIADLFISEFCVLTY